MTIDEQKDEIIRQFLACSKSIVECDSIGQAIILIAICLQVCETIHSESRIPDVEEVLAKLKEDLESLSPSDTLQATLHDVIKHTLN